MKNLVLVFMVMLFTLPMVGQEFEVTPNGLKDKTNLENDFVVIDTPGKTATELYQRAIEYINETYKNPEEVIKGNTENEYLRFNTHVSGIGILKNSGVKVITNANYVTELRFKDGKVRYEINSLEIYTDTSPRQNVSFSGKGWSYYIYNSKKGTLKQPDLKVLTELHFNSTVTSLTTFLMGETKTEDW